MPDNSIVTPTDSQLEISRVYPESYYQQHRNSILFSVATALLCLPHVSLSLDEVIFLKSTSELASLLIPWIIWIAASYSTLHFYVEWRDHAKPHALAISNQLQQMEIDLRGIFEQVKGLEAFEKTSKAIDDALAKIDAATSPQRSPDDLDHLLREIHVLVVRIGKDLHDSVESLLEKGSDRPDYQIYLRKYLDSFSEKMETSIQSALGGYTTAPINQADLASFDRVARSTQIAIDQMIVKLVQVLSEPRWVKQQIDLTRRWTTVRVWLLGFAPPFFLWLIASLLFLDSGIGYPLLHLLVSDAALQATG